MMSELTWDLLEEINGRFEAEMLKSFLEAEGIPVQLIQEGAGHTIYPVNIGALSVVQVFVPKDNFAEAQTLLEEFNRGVDMEISEDMDSTEDTEETDQE
jgi:hypothetical protein